MRLAFISGIISLSLSLTALLCKQNTVGPPWGCLPFALPNLYLFSYAIENIPSPVYQTAFILTGSFLEYFVAGYISSLIIRKK